MIPGDERANISENGLRRKSRQMAMVLGWSQWPQLPSESFPQISSLSTRVTIKHLHTKPGNRGLVIGWDQQMLQWPFFDWGPHQIEEVQIGRQRFAKTWRKHLNQKKNKKTWIRRLRDEHIGSWNLNILKLFFFEYENAWNMWIQGQIAPSQWVQ